MPPYTPHHHHIPAFIWQTKKESTQGWVKIKKWYYSPTSKRLAVAGCRIESYTNIISQLSGSGNWAWLGILSEPLEIKRLNRSVFAYQQKYEKTHLWIYIEGELVRQAEESGLDRIIYICLKLYEKEKVCAPIATEVLEWHYWSLGRLSSVVAHNLKDEWIKRSFRDLWIKVNTQYVTTMVNGSKLCRDVI